MNTLGKLAMIGITVLALGASAQARGNGGEGGAGAGGGEAAGEVMKAAIFLPKPIIKLPTRPGRVTEQRLCSGRVSGWDGAQCAEAMGYYVYFRR